MLNPIFQFARRFSFQLVQWHARLRLEMRDLAELVLLPGLVVVLPWAYCFRVFRWVATWPWLYRAQCDASLAQAQQLGFAPDPIAWKAQRRLVTLVDHADLYLAVTRSPGWMRIHLTVAGQWPAPDTAALLCTFHWGAGMWGLVHAAHHGLRPHALVAPMHSSVFAGRFVLRHYAMARTHRVGKVLRQATLDVSESLRPVVRCLNTQGQVLAAVDVPADQAAASHTITLLGRPARLPKALFRIAAEKGTPVFVYTTGFDLRTGQRSLTVQQIENTATSAAGASDSAGALIQAVFTCLDKAILKEPSLWHFWSEAPRFFKD